MAERKFDDFTAGENWKSSAFRGQVEIYSRFNEFIRKSDEAAALVEKLTPREYQVLTRLIQGDSNKQIARHLDISPRTVEIHRAGMFARLGARSAADAIRIGIYAGLDHPVETDGSCRLFAEARNPAGKNREG